jgi:hypothetical protein
MWWVSYEQTGRTLPGLPVMNDEPNVVYTL